jgi:DNA-binding LacI/PurR family transcriptional regulator
LVDPHKYQTVAARLRAEVQAAAATDLRFLPSERELTRRFGVDRSTIRRALEVLEVEGLIRRRPGRKTEVLKPGRIRDERRRIALVVNASPLEWATLPALQGAESVLTPLGYELSVNSTHAGDPFEAERRERSRLASCLERGVAGVLLWPASGHRNAEPLRRLIAGGTPVVLLDQQLPEPELDFVGIDNVAAAHSVTTHLIQTGHRRIAHFTRANTLPTTLQRIEGYRRALTDHGLAFEEEWLVRSVLGQPEKFLLNALLTQADRPTALFAINDMTALRLLHCLVQHGVRVPAEMAVAAIDDLPISEVTTVPLTTLRQPFEAMGAAAARLLIERIEGRLQGPPVVQLLPTRLIVRASCGARAARGSPAPGPGSSETRDGAR